MYGHNGGVNACSFSKYGDYFATGGVDSIVMLWKTNLEQEKTESIPFLETVKNEGKQKAKVPLKSTQQQLKIPSPIHQDANRT